MAREFQTHSDRVESGYFLSANVSGVKVVSDITRRLRERIATLSGQFVKRVAEIFVERAREKLTSTNYENTEHYAQNIVVKKYAYNNYRVGIERNAEKPIMYFLEFGTGLVGAEGSQDFVGRQEGSLSQIASSIGWRYAVGDKIKTKNILNPKTDEVIDQDEYWTYFDEKKGVYTTTRGLYPVAYMYDTIKEIPDIIEQVKKELGVK